MGAEVAELARGVRLLVFEIFPGAVEVAWPRQKIVGYGVGPKKMTEHFCWLGPYTSHVSLGFNHGVNLPDPEGRLEGSGKKFRHVKLREPADLKRPALRALVHAAVAERRRALGLASG